MKKYIFIFIGMPIAIYGMEQALTKQDEHLLAFLPLIPGNQRYFNSKEIETLSKDSTCGSITTYFKFLKNRARSTYCKTLDTLDTVIKQCNKNKEELESTNLLLSLFPNAIPKPVDDIDFVCNQTDSLMKMLMKDHDSWLKSTKELPKLHPLLFLKHPDNTIFFIIFDDYNWFDIKQGHIVAIPVPVPTISTTVQPQTTKKYDRYPHSIKKQKLVQDGR